jgi:hypothetical protein
MPHDAPPELDELELELEVEADELAAIAELCELVVVPELELALPELDELREEPPEPLDVVALEVELELDAPPKPPERCDSPLEQAKVSNAGRDTPRRLFTQERMQSA